MDGFTVYYHWKHGNGWFYCIGTWKQEMDGLPGDAACEQTKEII